MIIMVWGHAWFNVKKVIAMSRCRERCMCVWGNIFISSLRHCPMSKIFFNIRGAEWLFLLRFLVSFGVIFARKNDKVAHYMVLFIWARKCVVIKTWGAILNRFAEGYILFEGEHRSMNWADKSWRHAKRKGQKIVNPSLLLKLNMFCQIGSLSNDILKAWEAKEDERFPFMNLCYWCRQIRRQIVIVRVQYWNKNTEYDKPLIQDERASNMSSTNLILWVWHRHKYFIVFNSTWKLA